MLTKLSVALILRSYFISRIKLARKIILSLKIMSAIYYISHRPENFILDVYYKFILRLLYIVNDCKNTLVILINSQKLIGS